ncbi:MAG TPA: outer membrane protein assembly factor BamD [Burkholderiaceae bacterium]|nr:outer membrane protein assembly factor BamD [Burkholderiaceae bacterium]
MTTTRDRSGRRTGALLRAVSVALVAATLAGCGLFGKGGEIDRTAKMTPDQIYAEAKDEMSAGRYGEAIKLLGRLESRYPFGSWAQQAQLDTAYAHYKENDRTQALVTLERFMRLYPNSASFDYALYLKGLVNFNENQGLSARFGGQDLSERDQQAAREAFEAFRQIVTRFPDSRYAEDAASRMRYLHNAMAGGEIHTARYYFRRGAYLAAINRAQGVVKQYQTAPAVEEALYIMMLGYEKLGLRELRDDAERVLRMNFPDSTLFRTGLRLDGASWWQVWR